MKLHLISVNFSDEMLSKELINLLQPVLNLEMYSRYLNVDLSKVYLNEHQQYYSTQIITLCKNQLRDLEGYKTLLVKFDIYVPALTYIFGEAELNGDYSIVSLARLMPQFYGEVSEHTLFVERLKKEVMHELGHNFGLYHCIDWDCVMHSSNSIDEVDLKGADYCRSCRQKIGRDIVKVF